MGCGVGRRCGLDLSWLWLWCRLAAVAPVRPLAWELPYAAGAALKRRKKKKPKNKKQKTKQQQKQNKRKTEQSSPPPCKWRFPLDDDTHVVPEAGQGPRCRGQPTLQAALGIRIFFLRQRKSFSPGGTGSQPSLPTDNTYSGRSQDGQMRLDWGVKENLCFSSFPVLR